MSGQQAKLLAMPWNPTKKLSDKRRTQFRFTDGAGNPGFFLYPHDNGVNIDGMFEHLHFYPEAVAGTALQDLEKAQHYTSTLLPPATATYSRVLLEQTNAGVTDLKEILRAYAAERMGENGQRAAYRQIEGLKACMKPRSMKCFEWETNYTVGNDLIDDIPGPEAKMTDETFRRAYLETYPNKWVLDFEKVKTSDMSNTTVSAITAYMTDLETNSATSQLQNEQKQKANSSNRNRNGKGKWNNHKKNRRAKHDRPSPKGNNGSPKDDEQCRLHPDSNHTWKECTVHPKFGAAN